MISSRLPLSAAAAAVASAALYASTAARTVVFIDSGELATVAWTLGVAHPTGYPLYTLLAWIAAHLPAWGSVILRVNFLSVLLSSAAVGLFIIAASRVLHRGKSGREEAGRADTRRGEEGGAGTIALLFGALLLAFSETWWSLSASAEVYPLHALFLLLLIVVFLRAFPRNGAGGDRSAADPREAHLFAFLLGLAFANHMSTIYLAPAFLTLYVRRRGMRRESLLRLAAMAPAFVAGLSVYLYLPLRASADPVMNWGNTDELGGFLRHLGGKQYSVWIFSSAETASRQLGLFFRTLGSEFSWFALVPAVTGAAVLFRRDRDAFLLVALLFAGCLAFAVNYDIADIESYFLLAYAAVALSAAAGVRWALESAPRSARGWGAALLGIFIAWHAWRTLPLADQSGVRQVEQYTRTILESAEPGAMVMSYQWDYFVSASYYYQIVERVRPDVVVVDKELIRRSWYLDHLRVRYPALLEGLGAEEAAFRTELRKFEEGIPYDPRIIEARFTGLIAGMIRRHRERAPVYVTPEIEPQYTAGYARIPHGPAFRLVAPGEEDGWREVPVRVDPPARDDRYTEGITALAARAEIESARYLEARGRREEAARAAARAAAIRPDDPGIVAYLRRLTP